MAILVVGASGATGRLLVMQLLNQGEAVRVIVRSAQSLPEKIRSNTRLEVTVASLLDMTDTELEAMVRNCDAVASCLGHNLTFSGIFGRPRRLVTDSVKRLCQAVEKTRPPTPVKFVLMNTTGNQNKQADEKMTLRHRAMIGLIRHLLPPHADNEVAANYLQSRYRGDDDIVQWAVVRPDSLVDETSLTPYTVYPSPIRDPLFNAGKTSRINVAGFMAELVMNDRTWCKWQGHMPVIYNAECAQ